MAWSVARLLPGRGLDLSYIDDRALEGNPMRGCDNVRLVDAEWWTREGEKCLRGNTLPFPASYLVSVDLTYGNTDYRRHFLIGSNAVIEVAASSTIVAGVTTAPTYKYTVPYKDAWAGTVSFTNGSATATYTTSSGDPDWVNLLYGNDADGVQTVYFAKKTATGTFTLETTYKGATNASYSTYGFTGPDSNPSQDRLWKTGWTIFRQRVAYSVGDVWGGAGAAAGPLYLDRSPALAAGGIYLVWCPGVKGSRGQPGPYLIRLDATENLYGQFMRMTQASTSSATAFSSDNKPHYVATHRDRLVISRADENGNNDDRTVWYSQPGNLMYWHTGTAGGSPPATHNNIKLTEGMDPITALAPLGDSLIVHRARSQVALRPTGSAAFPPGPYTISYNDQGIGCVSQKTLVSIRGQHIFTSEYGPMVFDGAQCQPLNATLKRVASQLRNTAEWTPGGAYPGNLHTIYHAARQELWFSLPGTSFDSWESGSNAERYLVYNLETQEMTVSRYYSIYVGGTFRDDVTGQEIVVAMRNKAEGGTLLGLTQTLLCKDRSTTDPIGGTAVAVPAYVETKWHNFGSETEKEIVKLELDIRTTTANFYTNDTFTDDPGGDLTLTLEIHADYDLGSYVVQQVVTVPSASMNVVGYAEGKRVTPRVLVVPKVRCQGNLFKFRIRNTGTGTSTQPFRLSQMSVYFEERQSTRREKKP